MLKVDNIIPLWRSVISNLAKLEWLKDGVKTVMGPIPAIKYDEVPQCEIWFNSMVAANTGWEDARNVLRRP